MSLCLGFLGQKERSALDSRQLPDRERLRLQKFITGIKVVTRYRTHDPNRQRLVKGLTRENAEDRRFEIGDGQTMSVMEYFRQLNIPLQFPKLICVEVSTTLFLFPGAL
jgi:eukaryotic translation initiation factor 2C